MSKFYEKILDMRGNTFTVRAKQIKLRELALVHKADGTKAYAEVISLDGDLVTLQSFVPTRGLRTNDKVTFLSKQMEAIYGPKLLGRRLNGSGEPIDGGAPIQGEKIAIGGPSVNPVCRVVPNKLVRTNIPMIDVFNCLVKSQKIPIFSVSGEPYNALLMRIANQTDAEVVIIGGMGLRQDDYQEFVDNSAHSGKSEKTIMFIHRATDPAVECLLVPDMALACAEKFALDKKSVLVLLTDMTAFADAQKEIMITMDQIPSNRGYPGSLYSDLASRYEKAVDIKDSGSITIISVTTMPGGDVTHPVPDNTGYITEGQFYLHGGRIDPFGSLSRLKQMVIPNETREDHNHIANAQIRLYAEAKKARERQSMGFKLSLWDHKLLKFSYLFESRMMDLEQDISVEDALDLGWATLAECFEPQETGIKEEMLTKYFNKEQTTV